MITILGLVMIYSWIHTVVLNFTKMKDLTQYEKVVLWFSLVAFVLYVVGTINQ
jgi:hypothetical protein